MITATEAKKLYDQSGVEVQEYLKEKVEPKVTEAAKSGKRFTFIYLGSLEPYRTVEQELLPIQKAVVEKLQELGYRARVVLDGDKYVPRGLADDNGEGPKYQNYGIQVGW